MPKKQYPFLSVSGCCHSLPLSGRSGQCWHPSEPEPALLEATFPHWQVQGTGFWKESSLRFWPSLVLPHQRWLSWTRISYSPAFLTPFCKPREKLLIAPFTLLLSFPTVSPCVRRAGWEMSNPFLRDQEGPSGWKDSSSSIMTADGGPRQSLKGQLPYTVVSYHHLPPLCLRSWPVSHGWAPGCFATRGPPHTPVDRTSLSQDML